MKRNLVLRAVAFVFLVVACTQAQQNVAFVDSTTVAGQTADPSPSAVPVREERVVEKTYVDPRAFEEIFNRVSRDVLPVVVEINVVEVVKQRVPSFESPWDFFFGTPQFQEREFRRSGLGSGVIVRRDGKTVYVLTNAHVVGDADEISVKLYDQRTFPAKIVGKDERIDLAVVSFETSEEIPVARLGDSDTLEVGDWVLAVGNPYGFESTVTAGIVSALGRKSPPGTQIGEFTDYIQTDAAINPGNSGGALVNLDAEVIGINAWIASQTGGNVGLGFAIPINVAKRTMEQLIERGHVAYGWLGVTLLDPSDVAFPGFAEALGIKGKKGTLISNVYVGSPAWQAGLRPGDFVVRAGNTVITQASELSREIGMRSPGERVEIEVLRQGGSKVFTVRLGERKTDDELSRSVEQLWPGLMVTQLTDEVRERYGVEARTGVLVVQVAAGTPPAVAGLRAGDVITAVGDRAVRSVKDFYGALAETSRPGATVRFSVLRGTTEVVIGLKVPR
ncbi:protease Do [Spirochaeta thermophila DSM 6578]|uniref:Protease Do n=1 Tax=Winmispira thermophila (strain ATCC 700085 / DSM 6578 / Z-1203) TaxID=869211 RepID=G0GCK1_WINT7|nr:Do family serine endopeptidase [Spirochaeta thermophila]AEJ62067.1 protease Do [Spirochaeta thermophila DSM 6578]